MSTDTSSKLIEFSGNQPKFTSIADNSLVMASDKTFTGLSLPASTNTANQYVLRINANGDWFFDSFVVTSELTPTQSPSQWNMYGADNTKLAADGILVSAENGGSAYTISMTTNSLCALRYNTTTKKITAQTIYQAPKDFTDAAGNRLSKNGFVMSVNNGSKAEILEVPGNNAYAITKNASTGKIELTSVNNHTHNYYELFVSKYQTSADNSVDPGYIPTTSKPFYIVNQTGTGKEGYTVGKGTYLVNIDLDIVCEDLNLLQRDGYTFKFGLGTIPSETITVDNKLANRVNLHFSLIYTQSADSNISIVIGNAGVDRVYHWDKIKLTMVKILN